MSFRLLKQDEMQIEMRFCEHYKRDQLNVVSVILISFLSLMTEVGSQMWLLSKAEKHEKTETLALQTNARISIDRYMLAWTCPDINSPR